MFRYSVKFTLPPLHICFPYSLTLLSQVYQLLKSESNCWHRLYYCCFTKAFDVGATPVISHRNIKNEN